MTVGRRGLASVATGQLCVGEIVLVEHIDVRPKWARRRFVQPRRVRPNLAARNLLRAVQRTAWQHAQANGIYVVSSDIAYQRYHDVESKPDR